MEKILSSDALNDFLHTMINSSVSFVIHLAIAVVVFYVGRWIISRLYRWVHNLLNKRKADQSLTTFLLSLVRITLYFLLIVVVIGILGIETSSFIALFASAGVAIGMALSGTLQNFAGGVLILLLKPYKVGDFIEAQGFTGTVKEIQIFSTILTTGDNKSIIIPNGPLSTGSINNYSREEKRRVDWTVSIAYGSDYQKAVETVKNLLAANPAVITDGSSPAPMVEISALAASSVDLTVRAWVKSADYWDVFFGMNRAMLTALPAAGVQFPFPQLDVHMVK
ncbi:MAG: mechanosensitive ion channel [Muribaculaceae bacterium]|nr:mechanosensitive ion channel [Muribaculaceae bacterium]MDE6461363.1 mechanosensitive ion channel [Muribaculaceae bacterium]MDE6509804.1 mechanosensitive ion channel [Muribaculaceae bacterium]